MKNVTTILGLAIITLFLNSGCGFVSHITTAKSSKQGPYEAVIIPGIPYKERAENMRFIQRIRVFWAYHLVQTGVAERVIFSGGAVHTPYVEAEILAQYALDLGLTEDQILRETRAEHSTENVYYGIALAKSLGYEKIAVATDPFQVSLIKMNTRIDDLELAYLPIRINYILTKYRGINPELQDPMLAYKEDFVPLSDRLSEKEQKSGTAGQRFRDRYGLEYVTMNDLENLQYH